MAIVQPATARAGHPPGLYVLFFTELWERYSFYSMMAILTLYMDEHLHFARRVLGQVYGGYIGFVYFLPLAGGWLADRFLGFNRAVIVGAILMGLGHFVLAIEPLPAFFTALALLVMGSGLLKPNISTIVGNLYRDRPELRDAAFNIFYMGINIGAFIAPQFVSYFRAHYGWGVAFGSAGVAMGISLAIFTLFNRHVAAAARKVETGSTEYSSVDPADARARIVVLVVIFVIVIGFWIAFYQNGFTLTLWARDNTQTTWAPERFQSINPLCIILFSPVLVAVWGALRRRQAEPSTPMKMFIGMLFTAASFGVMVMAGRIGGDTGRVSPLWITSSYALISVGEICLSPMGLALVARVAPPRRRGLMMGGWFVTLAIGGYLSGPLGAMWDRMLHSSFFLLVVGITLVCAAVLLIVMRRVRRTIETVA